jgi:hypothetical protein
MINHYLRVAQKTASYNIMVDMHEPVRSTGLHRTYPNWLASEAARGNEFNAWSKGNNPDAPYDTIPIYGTGSNEIINYKIVKAEQYSVKHGAWKIYDPTTGRLIKSETYDRGFLPREIENYVDVADNKIKKVKPKEVLEYEKKHSGKKKVKTRDGQTGY